MKGKFITFEGGEGSGKSTQLRLLAEYLENNYQIPCVQTKEPGGTDVGIEIRRLLVEGDKDKMDAIAEALMYYADRRIHLTKKIWPALEGGKWVLSDRFADSTMAYQYYGYNKRVDKKILDGFYDLVVGEGRGPDLTLIFDIDPEIGLARSRAKAGQMEFAELRHESRELEFHTNLRKGYIEIAKENPNRYIVLDANKTIEELHEEVVKVIKERLEL
ncbi:MAG: dTMP kinase [Lactobacillus sp.]|jgi:dTMP kinase|nr:dTMP kinase [Lactobacillus sp.]